MRNWNSMFLAACLAVGMHAACMAQEAAPPRPEEAAIRQAVQSYVRAFNSRDAHALAALWSPEGVYNSRTSGDAVIGREEITKEFTALFSDEDTPQLAVATE